MNEAFPHYMRWKPRAGERCEIIGRNGTRVQVRFPDGYTAVVPRTYLRRAKEPTPDAEKNDGQKTPS